MSDTIMLSFGFKPNHLDGVDADYYYTIFFSSLNRIKGFRYERTDPNPQAHRAAVGRWYATIDELLKAIATVEAVTGVQTNCKAPYTSKV